MERKQDSDTYKIIDRADGSLKYERAVINHPGLIIQQSIVVSTADMQYAFPKALYQKLFIIHESPYHFGYTIQRQSLWKSLNNWVNSRYCSNIVLNENNTLFWNGLGPLIATSINILTQQNDNILLMTPTYYRYISDVADFSRNAVQISLIKKNNRYFIDFQALQSCFKSKKIKLFMFMNPWNPCGRIWSKQELQKLVDLVIKYKVFIFADEVFSDCVEPPQRFFSLLNFKQLHPYMILGSSPTKSMNCSGMPCAYSFIPNNQIYKQTNMRRFHGFWPTTLSLNLLQLIYTEQEAQNWRKQTISYIEDNYITFKKQCKQLIPQLIIMDLQCSYLVVVDFKAYNKINFSKFTQYFTKVNVCPTFMQTCYVDVQNCSQVRINIAINRQLISQLVRRLQKLIQISLSQ